MKIALTGASGFIGSAIIDTLRSSDIELLPLVRKKLSSCESLKTAGIDLEDLSSFDTEALKGCDSLIHTAARAHIMQDESLNPLVEYRRINRDATLELAKIAASAGVKRFIFLALLRLMVNQLGEKALLLLSQVIYLMTHMVCPNMKLNRVC